MAGHAVRVRDENNEVIPETVTKDEYLGYAAAQSLADTLSENWDYSCTIEVVNLSDMFTVVYSVPGLCIPDEEGFNCRHCGAWSDCGVCDRCYRRYEYDLDEP